jgi:hypothetical protein
MTRKRVRTGRAITTTIRPFVGEPNSAITVY